MTKLTFLDFTSLTNEASFLAALNANFTALETQLDLFVSRDGETPNTMTANLDMNNMRILNLPEPTNSNDPVRLQDVEAGVETFPGLIWTGEYDNGTAYEENDAVSYLGSSYIATADTTGNLPTDTSFWDVLASKGDVGSATVSDALSAIEADTASASTFYVWTASNAGGFQTISANGQTLVGQTFANMRTSLSLGGAALLAVGTTAGTVAAGNDSRFTAYSGNDQSGATYTYQITDAGALVRQTAGGTHDYTVAPFATIAIPERSVIVTRNAVGAGILTVLRGAGVTIYVNGSTTSTDVEVAAGGVLTLIQEATNVWLAIGPGVTAA